MIVQLNPPLPLLTPKGSGLAHFMIDYGPEFDLHWTVFLDNSGECWTFRNREVRACKNITLGRVDVARPEAQRQPLVMHEKQSLTDADKSKRDARQDANGTDTNGHF